LVFKPYINDFWGFLTDIYPRKWIFWGILGHLKGDLSPNFGRKLGMDNQLQMYKNQSSLRPWEDSQIMVMLKQSQAKAIFMQGRC
jgi:hypothetical protein